ncbi:MAG: hypothetical protein AB7L28_04260 [Kofleriaceae bacterium]
MVSVGQIGRFRIGGRLPYSSQYVGGLGVWDNEVVVSLSLVPVQRGFERESTGILLRTPQSAVRWALEIAAPVGLVSVASVASPTQTSSTRPSWLLTATTSTERTILWINVDEMISSAERAA